MCRMKENVFAGLLIPQCASSDSSIGLVGVSGEFAKIGATDEACVSVIGCGIIACAAGSALDESAAAMSLADSSSNLR